jgi:hypothetical protein
MALQLGGVTFAIKISAGRSATQVTKVAVAFERLQKSTANLKDLERILGKAKKATAEQGAAAEAASRPTKKLADSTQVLAQGIAALASALGTVRLASFIRQATILAGRVENFDTIVRNTAKTANFSGGQVSLYEDRIRSLGITTRAARFIMTRFAQNQLELADAANMSRIAQDAAVVAGVNSSQAAEKLTIAIQRLDTRMLRNLGILVNLRQEYQAYGAATGRVETSLTAAEKQQIVLNAVMREGAALAGNYEAAMGDAFKRFTSLERKVEEATKVFGEQFLPIFAKVVDATDWFLTKAEEHKWLVAIAAGVTTFTVAVGALTTVLLTAQVAVVGYSRAVLGMAAAEAKAITATVALTTALKGLRAFLLTTPAGIFILIAAGVATLATAISSLAQAVKEAREQRVRDIQEEVATSASVKELVAEIENLEAVQNRTALEDSRLHAAMRSIIALAKEGKVELQGLADNADAFIKKTGEIFPGYKESLQERIDRTSRRAGLAERQLDVFRKAGSGRVTTLLQNPMFGPVGTTANIEDVLRDPDLVENRAARQELYALIMRDFDKMDSVADTAEQLALRARDRLEQMIIRGAGSSTLRDAHSLDKMTRNLTVGYQSREDIDRRHKERLNQIELDYLIQRDEILARNSEQVEEEIARNEAAQRAAEIAAGAKHAADLTRMSNTLDVFNNLAEIYQRTIDDVTAEADALEKKEHMLTRGVGRDAIDFVQGLEKQHLETTRAVEQHRKKIAELEEEHEKLGERISQERKKAVREDLLRQQRLLENKVALERAGLTEGGTIAEMKRLDEIRKFREKIVSDSKSFMRSINEASAQTDIFIARESGNEVLAKRIEEVARFQQAASQVVSSSQLRAILDIVVAKGGADFLGPIAAAGKVRLLELQRQREDLRLRRDMVFEMQASLQATKDLTVATRDLTVAITQRSLQAYPKGIGAIVGSVASSFASGFNAADFIASVARFSAGQNKFQENVAKGMTQVKEVFESHLTDLTKVSDRVIVIADEMREREKRASRALTGAGLIK